MAEQRMIRRAINRSDKVNSLSWPVECFFRRLLLEVDDFGRMDARPAILRSELYALKLNQVSDADVAKWLGDCSSAGLISIYEVEGKKYLLIHNYSQRMRTQKSKYPPPPAALCRNPPQSAAIRRELSAEVEGEIEVDNDGEGEDDAPPTTAFLMTGLVNIDSLKEKVILDRGYFTDLHCMKYRIDRDCLYQWLVNFNKHIRFLGTEVKTEKDYRSHFANWLSKQENKQAPKEWEFSKTAEPKQEQASTSMGSLFKKHLKNGNNN